MLIKCKNCGFENQMGAIFCRGCGEKIDLELDIETSKIEQKRKIKWQKN